MKLLGMALFLFSIPTFASSSYLNSNDLVFAAQNVFGGSAGFATTNCNLCHISGQTGNGTIASGFGTDFLTATAAEGFAAGSRLNQSQLETVLRNNTLQEADSDGDGQTNAVEITAATNPNDCSSGGTCPARSGGGGGGCGLIKTIPTNTPPSGLMLFLLIPLFLNFRLRENKT